jgi:hypothetical protein
MDFEEMKMIWDAQKAEPLYAINEAALHQSVRRKARRFKGLIVFFESAVIAGAAGPGAFYAAAALLRGQHARLVPAAILLGAAAFFALGIKRRRQREAEFESSLLGDIDKALWQVRHHMSRARGLRWTVIAPMCAAVAVDWLFLPGGQVLRWPFVLFVLIMALAARGIEYEIRCLYLPKERQLEALHKMLVGDEGAALSSPNTGGS